MLRRRIDRKAFVGLVMLALLLGALSVASYSSHGWMGVLVVMGSLAALVVIQIAVLYWIDQGEPHD